MGFKSVDCGGRDKVQILDSQATSQMESRDAAICCDCRSDSVFLVQIPVFAVVRSPHTITEPRPSYSVGVIQGGCSSFTNFSRTSSSSTSCRAASTDIPDPLSPLLPIIHRSWQVFRVTSRILT